MVMKKKDLDNFKKLLIEEKRKILRHLEDLNDSAEEDLTYAGDPADIASVEISQASLQKIGKRETMLLKKIDKALEKIEDKSYGLCESCGEEIGVPRLTARPVAEMCIDCKTAQENIERRYSQGEEEEEGDSYSDETEEV